MKLPENGLHNIDRNMYQLLNKTNAKILLVLTAKVSQIMSHEQYKIIRTV
jgi:GTP-binding protein EngB required for normal cell division